MKNPATKNTATTPRGAKINNIEGDDPVSSLITLL